MTQQKPSPRQAVISFGVPMSQSIIVALGALISADGSPWEAEDSLYALRDHSPLNRPLWVALELAIQSKADPEQALSLAESTAAGMTEGQPPNPTSGTESDVIAVWDAHRATASSRRARLRALSRVIANRVSPDFVLAALQAGVDSLPNGQ